MFGSASRYSPPAAPRRRPRVQPGSSRALGRQWLPRGLAENSITFGGHILTAADACDALTSKRAYRDPLSATTTLDDLLSQLGRLLEPRIYESLAAVVRRGSIPDLPQIT